MPIPRKLTHLVFPLLVSMTACTIYEADSPPPDNFVSGDAGEEYPPDAGQPDGDPDASIPNYDGGLIPNYDGGLIPEDAQVGPDCSLISDEAICVVTADCRPLYEGIDCSCNSSGCECAEWVFETCE